MLLCVDEEAKTCLYIISTSPKLVKIHVTFRLKENYKHTYKALLIFPMADSSPAFFTWPLSITTESYKAKICFVHFPPLVIQIPFPYSLTYQPILQFPRTLLVHFSILQGNFKSTG